MRGFTNIFAKTRIQQIRKSHFTYEVNGSLIAGKRFGVWGLGSWMSRFGYPETPRKSEGAGARFQVKSHLPAKEGQIFGSTPESVGESGAE